MLPNAKGENRGRISNFVHYVHSRSAWTYYSLNVGGWVGDNRFDCVKNRHQILFKVSLNVCEVVRRTYISFRFDLMDIDRDIDDLVIIKKLFEKKRFALNKHVWNMFRLSANQRSWRPVEMDRRFPLIFFRPIRGWHVVSRDKNALNLKYNGRHISQQYFTTEYK
jgi:hypothetical protein